MESYSFDLPKTASELAPNFSKLMPEFSSLVPKITNGETDVSKLIPNVSKLKESFGNLISQKKDEAIEKNIERSKKAISDLETQYKEVQEQVMAYKKILEELCNKVTDSKKEGLNVVAEIKNMVEQVKALRTEMENSLMSFAVTGWGSGKSAEEILDELVTPLIDSVLAMSDVIKKLELPDIPLIKDIPAMLQKFSNLGRIINHLPPELKNAARQKVEELKQSEASGEPIEANNGKTWSLAALKSTAENILNKIINDIVELYGAVVDMLEIICSCAEIYAILLLIDKFKPIIEQFKLMVGDVVTILTSSQELLKCVLSGKYAMLNMLKKVIKKKLEDAWNVLVYVCAGNGYSTDVLISGCWSSIVSSQCDLSSIALSIDLNKDILQNYIDASIVSKYSNKIDKIAGYINTLSAGNFIDSEKIEIESIRKSLFEQKKEKLLSVDFLKNYEHTLSSYAALVNFDINKVKLYSSLIDSNVSLDKFLNPGAVN